MPLRYRFLTVGSLAGLAIGFGCGIVVFGREFPAISAVMAWLSPIEGVWIDILRVVVYPLIVSYLIIAVDAALDSRVTGKIGGIAIASHVGLLVIVTIYTITIGPAILAHFPLSPESIQAFRLSAQSEVVTDLAADSALNGQTAQAFLPRLYSTLVSLDIVVVLVVSVLFAILLSRSPKRLRRPALSFFRMISKGSMLAVDVLLLFMPVVIVVVTFNVTVKIGGRFVGTLGYWLILISSLLAFATLGLYVVAAWIGRVSIARFAQALLPVQLLGVASRSSIVCLPKLIEAGRDHLNLPEHVTGIVLPLSVSTFKLNRMVSTPMNLYFLAHLYGIDLDPAIAASLIVTAMIVSFATPGIPSGGKFTTLPIYLAAGIPVEGVVLLKAVDAIPDLFKTLINVTEDLTVATIVARFVPIKEKNSNPGKVYPRSTMIT